MISFSICLLEQLMTLISAAKEHGIEFIYAISPGLDITFSNQKEVSALKRKLDQVFWHFHGSRIVSVKHCCLFFCHFLILLLSYFNPPLSPGYTLWLQVICLTFWWYWPQHVPCWQRSVQLFCACSGFHYKWNIPVPGRAWNFPFLSYRYFYSMS